VKPEFFLRDGGLGERWPWGYV